MLEQRITDRNLTIISQSLSQALDTILRTIPKLGTNRPKIGQPDLTYQLCGDSDWVDGFWSGQLWLAYHYTQNPAFCQAARRQQAYFATRLKRVETHDHDMGFLYSLSAVADYKLTGSTTAKDLALAAARSLSLRFNPKGNFIRAWNAGPHDSAELQTRKRGKIILDSMENLGLLYWATQLSEDNTFRDIAMRHADTVCNYMVRPDNSSYHTFDFDPDTGLPVGGSTVQGYADESCWSRGQAWGVHGFAMSYAYTGKALYKETACRLADYICDHLPADGVPYWDYCLPADVPHYRDSSAGAITASGLLWLADLLTHDQENELAGQYRSVAQQILMTLSQDYTTDKFGQAEGLLLHGASHVANGYFDNMLPYGDYFYLEALLRATGKARTFFW